MPTPSLQTLVTSAQAVLSLQNMTTIRSAMAVALANANTGTPLSPSLTNQQLIDEAFQVMTLPKSDIESIIVNQMMKFLASPPAPGGAGANKQVIWNDAGVLTGDPNFTWDGSTSRLTVSNITITGAATAAGLNVTGATIPANGLYLPSANNLGFAYNSTLGMTLNSNGLGVGVTPTAGKGALQLSSGINFPATQVASTDPNTLDDYEEGTWTGTLKGLTTDPTTPVTATGRYTKIGRQVSIQIQFNNADTTGASGQIKVAGAPFASNGTVGSTGSVMMSSIGSFTGVPVAFIGTGTTEIELYAFSSAGAQTFVTHNAGTARSLWVSLTYTV